VLAAPIVTPAKADVYVTAPAPVYVYPRPFRPWRYYAVAPVVYAPAPVAHACTTRLVRVWTGERYVSRRVTRCY
jgi:hypothetical protein